MAANKTRNKTEREKELLEVSRMYLRGVYQADIAEKLGISQPQISYDLRVLRDRWRKESGAAIDEAKARELAKIDHLEAEYWQAWIDSQEERTKTVTARKGEESSGRIEKEERNGDPRYLQGVQWCIEQRCKILEIGVKTKQELTGRDGGPLTVKAVDYGASIAALAPRPMGDSEPSGKD